MPDHDDHRDMTPLGLLERLSTGLGSRVDTLEVNQADGKARHEDLLGRFERHVSRCADAHKAAPVTPPEKPWLRRVLLDPAVKQPHLIALYALVILIGAKSLGCDVSAVQGLIGLTSPVPETSP